MTLYEFYGETCPHCENMEPKIEQLKEEEDVEIEKKEVWNDQENAEKMKELDDGRCGGVPFFINTESGEFICGEADLETLKNWARGEQV
jgi:thiol-disulfide isomerase/thioredoxin